MKLARGLALALALLGPAPAAHAAVVGARALRGARRVALVVSASRPSFPARTLTLTTPTTRR
jgi:hypothetical protein